MPNLTKALLVFSSWAIIALISHFLLSKYQPNFCSHIEHLKIEGPKTVTGTHFYLVSNSNDTLSHYKFDEDIFKTKLDIDTIGFINNQIQKFKNDYRLKLKIKFHSNFSTSQAENDFISQIGSKLEKPLNNLEFLKLDSTNVPKNSIDFTLLKKNKEAIDSIEFSITSKILYLEFENNEVIESRDLKAYSILLQQYLQHNINKTVSITGHTSNDGYFENNLAKGLQMANSLKDYFINNKKVTTEINTYSRGEAEPIANKYTEEGKLLNKRIEIKVN